ncbi:MAG: bifunctional DNA-formamidopyrimidine glycosylase/DNA-(apurinic or apyrimidinic site) lyase [Gemmatimonadetes bacterium]|nr:bifunctional DNA-formamidopyrimidine glycosylase/DNA-(apurinic or apyrimidinic site) lyase [Gemmatimonadota bacterium]
MPELPETETIARDLHGAVGGAVIGATSVPRPDVLREVTAVEFAERTTGAQIGRVWRRAKSVILDISTGDRLVVTPRFTGALLIEAADATAASPAPTSADYTAIHWQLTDGRTLRYRDVRRLGTVALMSPERFERWTAALGPEPLDPALTAERFSGIVRVSSRAVKSILMDQRRMAGIGNIYANEALWRAKIRPTRRGTALSRAAATTLLAEIRAVLTESIALRGTSFRDYRDAFGGRGGFVERLAVYGRAGEPCTRCGTTLRSTHAIEGRSTVFCPTCQR